MELYGIGTVVGGDMISLTKYIIMLQLKDEKTKQHQQLLLFFEEVEHKRGKN